MKNLRKIREKQGLTQDDLAYMCEVKQANIAMIEKNKTCSMKLAIKIADILNVSLDELCGRDFNPKEFTGTHAKILNDVITKLVELEDYFYDE